MESIWKWFQPEKKKSEKAIQAPVSSSDCDENRDSKNTMEVIWNWFYSSHTGNTTERTFAWSEPEKEREKQKAPITSFYSDENPMSTSSSSDDLNSSIEIILEPPLPEEIDDLDSSIEVILEPPLPEEIDQQKLYRPFRIINNPLPLSTIRKEPSRAKKPSVDEYRCPPHPDRAQFFHRRVEENNKNIPNDGELQKIINSNNTVKPISDGPGLEKSISDWFGPEQRRQYKVEKSMTTPSCDQNPKSVSTWIGDKPPKSFIVEKESENLTEKETRVQETSSSTKPSRSRSAQLLKEFDENPLPPVKWSEPKQNDVNLELNVPPIVPEGSDGPFARILKKFMEEQEKQNPPYEMFVCPFAE